MANLEKNAQASPAVAIPSSTRLGRMYLFIIRESLIVFQTENLRTRWRGTLKKKGGWGGGGIVWFSWLYDLKDYFLRPIPKGVVCQLHLWITEF